MDYRPEQRRRGEAEENVPHNACRFQIVFSKTHWQLYSALSLCNTENAISFLHLKIEHISLTWC